jgi:hypothetical protein
MPSNVRTILNVRKNFGRYLLAVTLFMERYVRFVDWKVLNNERSLTIASSIVAVISAGEARNYIVTDVCSDSAWNEMSLLNELQKFSLPS